MRPSPSGSNGRPSTWAASSAVRCWPSGGAVMRAFRKTSYRQLLSKYAAWSAWRGAWKKNGASRTEKPVGPSTSTQSMGRHASSSSR